MSFSPNVRLVNSKMGISMNPEHPTPWRIAGRDGVDRLLDAEGKTILEIGDGQFQAMLNATRAMNTHAALVEALKDILGTALEKMDGDNLYVLVSEEALEKAQEALRQAEEGK